MLCKTSFLLLTMLIVFGTTNAQLADLEEKKPVTIDGVEYGYIIKNGQTKTAKGEEYGRFEITLYATNKSGCTKLMFPNQRLLGLDYQDVMAEFDCLNATGKRLTSKSAKVKAREFNTPYTYTTRGTDGKDFKHNVTVKVGNMLKNGETIYNNFIVILPEGERPNMKVRIIEIVE